VNESELMQKVRAGEKDAFNKWMDIYSGDIERFAIQYGCTLKQAADVAEETFRNLHRQLDSISNEESLVCTLYKKALKSLAFVQQTDVPNETIFPFDEDQELHDQIVNLEMQYKVPFILSQFHILDDSEIAKIMDTSLVTVEQAITVAFRDVGDAHLEKRLEFLNKSYRRMKSSFRKELVFAKPQQEIRTTGKLKQTISKKAMISWIAGIIVLLSLLIVPVVTSEEHKIASVGKYLERLTVSFEKEIGRRYTELGLKELSEEDESGFPPIQYGEKQRSDFETMVRRYKSDITKTGAINKKELKKEYRKIIKSLELPSEMAVRLFKNPLTADLKKSDKFMEGYLEQFIVIQHSYYSVLYKDNKIIEDAVVDGEIDIDEFLKKKETYPEELQLAIDGMIKQNIYLTPLKNWGTIVPLFGKNEVSTRIRSSIHPDIGGFLTLLEHSPLLMYPGLTYSVKDSIDYLLEMEKTLLVTTLNDEATRNLSWTYAELFLEIIGGEETEKTFGTNGAIKDEFRKGWERIASSGEGSPTAVIMQIIISEMEATDWTVSKSLKRLGIDEVHQALELAKVGKLETFSMSSDYAN